MANPARLEAVLFDFGGVFLDSPFAAVREFGERAGIPDDGVLELVFGRYDADTDHPWHRLERGEIDFLSARREIIDLSTAAGHRVDLVEAFATLVRAGIRAEMVAVAREVRAAGLKSAIVTNNVREFGESWRAMLPLDELFDAVVDSHEIGLRKPDPRIYEHALGLLGGVAPASAVFLDDFEGNVAAAERLGMQGILVDHDDWPRAIDRLRSLVSRAAGAHA
ncbi:HAD family phosphatase [bacterium]|nr:HAD family phosphatase [bacterium]